MFVDILVVASSNSEWLARYDYGGRVGFLLEGLDLGSKFLNSSTELLPLVLEAPLFNLELFDFLNNSKNTSRA